MFIDAQIPDGDEDPDNDEINAEQMDLKEF